MLPLFLALVDVSSPLLHKLINALCPSSLYPAIISSTGSPFQTLQMIIVMSGKGFFYTS